MGLLEDGTSGRWGFWRMGLLTGLLTLPLTPARSVIWLAERIEDTAYAQYSDPATIHAETGPAVGRT
jgi:hypothetical protein